MKFICKKPKSSNVLQKEIKLIKREIKKGYNTVYASLNLPKDNLAEIKKVISLKKKLKPEKIIVVGIGGSNLGTKAIIDAKSNEKVLFADTVDSDKTKKLLEQTEAILKSKKNVIVNVVSKSGTTTETIALFEVFVQLIKKYKKNYYEFIVVTTDKDSKLDKLSRLQGFSTLTIPKFVGGRFSVFSAVGLFPLGIAGIKIDELIDGANIAVKKCLMNNNPVLRNAQNLFFNYKKGKTIYDHFIFDSSLESLGLWYRQLLAESIGKEKNKKNKKVNVGITPTVSIGSTDLHSMAQLYLGGPKNRYTTFLRVTPNNSIKLPLWKEYDSLVKNIQGKKLDEIMNSIYSGVKSAYDKKSLPYSEIVLENKSEKELGLFMQTRMIEIIFLGALFDVNPFDQPAVETYKTETRKLLNK